MFQRSLFNRYLREKHFVCITATSIKQLHLACKLGALPQRIDSKDLQFVVNCGFLSFFPLHFRNFKTFFRRTLAQIFPSNTKCTGQTFVTAHQPMATLLQKQAVHIKNCLNSWPPLAWLNDAVWLPEIFNSCWEGHLYYLRDTSFFLNKYRNKQKDNCEEN